MTRTLFGTQHLSRRDSLIFGSLAGFGLLSSARTGFAAPRDSSFGRAKRCVLVWLDGGPSHLEMFDPKPETSAEVRGPLDVIKTKIPGVVFGESLPQLAKRTEKFCVIRSMTSPVGEHNLATQYALSGHIPGGRAAAPAFALPASQIMPSSAPLPSHIAIPNFSLGGGSKLQGYLGDAALPWSLGVSASEKDWQDKIFPDHAMSRDRLERRKALIDRGTYRNTGLEDTIDLLTNVEAKKVFDLQKESSDTRRRYGNKAVGVNCLVARRLLESGVPIVTINNKGWDTHERLKERLHLGYTGAKVPMGLVPSLDLAVSALLDDLQTTGLIDETLVVVMGEFGRTPKINTRGGRDHWPRAYSVLLAGAGIQSGTIYGSSDRVGENAKDQPVTPSDLVATLYHLLGLDPFQRQMTPDGQEVTRVPEQASVVGGVLA